MPDHDRKHKKEEAKSPDSGKKQESNVSRSMDQKDKQPEKQVKEKGSTAQNLIDGMLGVKRSAQSSNQANPTSKEPEKQPSNQANPTSKEPEKQPSNQANPTSKEPEAPKVTASDTLTSKNTDGRM